LSLQESCFFLKIAFWLTETQEGELEDLNYYGSEYGLLYLINASSGFVLSSENEYLEKEFFKIARERAKKADIVIINNNILFQDIIAEGKILGGLENLVLDEAHNLEDVVTQSLKKRISGDTLRNNFDAIEKILVKEKLSFAPFLGKKEELFFEVSAFLDLAYEYLFSKISLENKYKTHLLEESFLTTYTQIPNLGEKLQYIF